LCAPAAIVSAAWIVPITVPGGNPITAAAGDTPRSPVTMVGPVLFTFGVAPRTAKLCATPSGGATAAAAGPEARRITTSPRFASTVCRELVVEQVGSRMQLSPQSDG